jgi:NTP pyrophosphatase (non-canonical NTP hydrolase)
MSKSLTQIQKDINEFCKEREWNHKHPNDLISSIMIELGELAEHYQWQNEFKELSKEEKKELGYEFVDVLFYFCTLANKAEIDLQEAFYDKLPKLKEKFKDGKHVKEMNKKYRASGKNKLYD